MRNRNPVGALHEAPAVIRLFPPIILSKRSAPKDLSAPLKMPPFTPSGSRLSQMGRLPRISVKNGVLEKRNSVQFVIMFYCEVWYDKGESQVEQRERQSRFNGAAWFERQVQLRTRAALTERGSTAKTKSQEYKTEYARQLELFRAERAEVKRKKAERYAALMEKKLSEERAV